MVSVGEVQTDVVVDGEGGRSNPAATKEELREIVRELLEEMLERYLRTEERGG
ncbi:hypothetical protein [Sorangium sp. So ce406]|uniref:hypothetical protein n=1 Tax=Sorangium sp. So ce406 TaxID=3133311 RepID=UPI003F5B1DFF